MENCPKQPDTCPLSEEYLQGNYERYCRNFHDHFTEEEPDPYPVWRAWFVKTFFGDATKPQSNQDPDRR